MTATKWSAGIVCATAALCGASFAATAQDFYQDKQVRIIVGSVAGGGYDHYARMLQRHMPKHIPGNPSILVQNLPGAGGLATANNVYNIAPKDGTVFAMLNRYNAVMPILGVTQAMFKAETFQWLGTTASYSDNSYLLVLRGSLPYRTIEDLRKPGVLLHVGNSGSDVPAILKEALGLNLKIISGYKGHEEIWAAFERGEIDVRGDSYISIMATKSAWIDKQYIRPIIQFGRLDRLPELADVPTARELARTSEDRELIEFAEAPLLIARPFAAAPGVPENLVEILRSAFMKTVSDPDYVAEVHLRKMEHTPQDGAAVQAVVAKMVKASPSVVSRYLKALDGNLPSGG